MKYKTTDCQIDKIYERLTKNNLRKTEDVVIKDPQDSHHSIASGDEEN